MTTTAQRAVFNHVTSEKNELDYVYIKRVYTVNKIGRVDEPLPGLELVTILIPPLALPIVAGGVVRFDASCRALRKAENVGLPAPISIQCFCSA